MALVVTAIMVGCAAEHATISEDAFIAAVERSPAYRELQTREARPVFMIDGRERDDVLIAIGENFADRFLRCGTLRVSPDGKTSRQEFDEQGEERWVRER